MIDSEEDTDIPRDDEPDANVKTDGKSEGVENEDIRNEGVKHEGVKKGDSSSGQAVRSAVVDAADPVLIVKQFCFQQVDRLRQVRLLPLQAVRFLW